MNTQTRTIATHVLALLVIGASAAKARLNETLEQCVARYGEPKSKDPETAKATFEKAGIRVVAHFYRGKVDEIWYFAPGVEHLSDAQIKILASNNFGEGWGAMTDDPSTLHSHSFDRWGTIAPGNAALRLYTAAFLERERGNAKGGDAERKLEGF